MFQLNLFNSSIVLIRLDKPCNCGCSNAYVIETPHLIHYGKLECADCGKFIKWQPKPKNLEIAQDFAQSFQGKVTSFEVKP